MGAWTCPIPHRSSKLSYRLSILTNLTCASADEADRLAASVSLRLRLFTISTSRNRSIGQYTVRQSLCRSTALSPASFVVKMTF